MGRKMTVYISGKITGTTDYMERFAAAEKKLKAAGYQVINPARVTAQLPELTHAQYMEICLAMLRVSDAYFLLDGWISSKGAIEEVLHAARMGIRLLAPYDIEGGAGYYG